MAQIAAAGLPDDASLAPVPCGTASSSRSSLFNSHSEARIPGQTAMSSTSTVHGMSTTKAARSSSAQPAPQGVEWRYITFDTDLPSPNPESSKADAPTPVPPPDLSKLGDPKKWSTAHKWTASLISSIGCLFVAYASAAYAFAISGVEEEFGVSFNLANVGLTLYNIGFGVTPMLCAPLSESLGRYPVFALSGALFVVAQLCCGVTTTFGGLMVCRFLAGCGGSTFSTIVGGIVSDLFPAEKRNAPMAVFSSTTLAGVGVGLAISGAVSQDLGWRWIFYIMTILSAAIVIVVIVFLRETRGSVVLRRRAAAINQWYEQLEAQGYVGVQDPDSDKKTYRVLRWKAEADEKRPPMLNLIWTSLVRPFEMLFTEPVVFFFALWATFAWGILYAAFESIPLVFTTRYGFGDRANGLVFLSMFVGTVVIALPLCIVADSYVRSSPKMGTSPESRLYFVCLMGACLPIGLFWFGFTAQTGIPWIVPVLAVGCLSIGIFFVYLAVFNYFADVYGLYASSAMAASSFCRNIFSGVFPYFSNLMFIRLTFQGASSLLGGVAILLMVAPILLLLNGPKIRAKSRYVQ